MEKPWENPHRLIKGKKKILKRLNNKLKIKMIRSRGNVNNFFFFLLSAMVENEKASNIFQ